MDYLYSDFLFFMELYTTLHSHSHIDVDGRFSNNHWHIKEEVISGFSVLLKDISKSK